MFNIVKRRDFMLGSDVATKEEAEQAARDYGKEYVTVQVDPTSNISGNRADRSSSGPD